MLSIGVLPLAKTTPLRFAVHDCCVSPRKYGPVGVVNWKFQITSGFPSPLRST
jgi:hypothetical protein